jgi:hypothetical protein
MRKTHRSEHNGNGALTTRQEQAIQALLTGASVNEAAKNAHIGRTTLYRWLNDTRFRAAYRAAQERSQAWTVNRLQVLAAKAIQALEHALDDRESPAMVKVEAARVVLELTFLRTKSSRLPVSFAECKSEVDVAALHLESALPQGRGPAAEHELHKNPAHSPHESP